MNVELEKFGYTDKNLYTKEKRERKVIVRHLFQTTLGNEELWEEAEGSKIAYITKELAAQLPEEIYLASTFDNSRIVFETEEDLVAYRNAIFGSVGPEYDEKQVPHVLFEEELK